MLSGACFLHHLQIFCGISILRLINLISDNQGLLTRITQRQHYSDNYATATLAADWDLIEQLNSSLTEYITSPKFTHVKGHQDTTKAYDKYFCLDAQLNVDTDVEAGNFQWNQAPTHRTSVPLPPTTCAHFHIADTTITGHYRYHIRNAASTPEFFDKC
jgi:hypothetical protein